jgi:hypothetical protein
MASPAQVAEGIFDAIGHKSRRQPDGSYLVHCVVHHPDEHPSLHVTATSDTVLVHCLTGCSDEQILEELRKRGLWFPPRDAPDLPVPIRRGNGSLEPVVIYRYRNTRGTVIAEKARFEGADGKWFKWRKPGVVHWPADSGLKMADVPLYGADKVGGPGGTVYFCEGEKATEACQGRGLRAVTLAGGAGQKDFGSSLEILKAHDVVLWPDNDAPGRTLMRMVEAALRQLAVTATYVALPISLPEKGDAADYFALGGKVEDIGSQRPDAPVVTITGDDSVRVVMPTVKSPVVFDFEELEKGGRELNCRLTINFFEAAGRPIIQRQNLESNSQRTELRRDLDVEGGKEYEWTRVLREAFYLARTTFLNQERGSDVGTIPRPIREVELIPPLMPADGATVVFANGASCKSYIAAYLALSGAMGWECCRPFEVPHGPVLYLDYESGPTTFRMRCGRLAEARGVEHVGGVWYWDPRGLALRDCWEPIRDKVVRDGIRWIVVDSAGPACGGEAEKADAVLQFFGALNRIGVPALVIAHVTKNALNNKEMPFGSVMWGNAARRTWYVAKTESQPDSDVLKARMICKKVNDGRPPRDIGLEIRFQGSLGPVFFESLDPDEEPELVEQTSARHQLYAVLGQPATVTELVEATGLKRDTVQKTLRRGPFAYVRREDGEFLWSRQASEQPDEMAF